MSLFRKKKNTQPKDRIFLDYASTTPVSKEVFLEMEKYFSKEFQNPSALYKEGVEIQNIVQDSKERISKLLHVRKKDIYFTASGTEADNLALLGLFEKYKTDEFSPHFIVSNIEHPAILETAKEIERRGGEVSYIKVNEEGLVDPKEIRKEIKENTILISIMYASNEIGTIQPISRISREVRLYKQDKGKDVKDFPYVHTDAAQAPNYLDLNCEKLGVDMMTLDGSKIYGPKGIGLLYKKHSIELKPIMFGGGQEEGLRSGTENVPAIVGFTKALEVAVEKKEEESKRLTELRNYFIKNILEKIPNSRLNGSDKKEERLPNNINICIPNINAEFEVIRLDEKGIACAYTTACKTLGDESKSYVVEALGKENCASSSLRFTLGRDTTKEDIDLTLDILSENFS